MSIQHSNFKEQIKPTNTQPSLGKPNFYKHSKSSYLRQLLSIRHFHLSVLKHQIFISTFFSRFLPFRLLMLFISWKFQSQSDAVSSSSGIEILSPYFLARLFATTSDAAPNKLALSNWYSPNIPRLSKSSVKLFS